MPQSTTHNQSGDMTAPRRVLLIQESKGIDPAFRNALESASCALEVAATPADALRRVRNERFDVVVTSPLYGVSEDIALLAELRHVRPDLKSIVLALEATPEDVVVALRSHAFACYRSPIDPVKLASMVDRALAAEDWRNGITVMSASRDWIVLQVASRRLTAERLIAFMDVLLSGQTDDHRDSLLMAFREILLNAMEHGAGFAPEKTVEVSAIRTAKAIVFHFRDPGPGFSLDDLPHAAVSNRPDQPIAHVEYRLAAGMRPGGFGLLMAKRLVDEVIYNGTGNEVILIKHAHPS